MGFFIQGSILQRLVYSSCNLANHWGLKNKLQTYLLCFRALRAFFAPQCKVQVRMITKFLEIRETIASAKNFEAKHGNLRSYLQRRIPSLHKSIVFNQGLPSDSLFNFTTHYIDRVPALLEALHEISSFTHILPITSPYIVIAQDYLIREESVDDVGMLALLQPAYLSCRLIEEFNDRVFVALGMPLLPVNMNIANLVVHAIIGDELADHLDFAVHLSIESLFRAEKLQKNAEFAQSLRNNSLAHWQHESSLLPCLAENFAISLELLPTLADTGQHHLVH